MLVGGLVAMYRVMRLRFGYRFESSDANGLRNVKDLRNKTPFFPLFRLVVRHRLSKCLNEGNFMLQLVWHRSAAICVSKVHSGNGYRGEISAMRNR